jgi:hypothetical protein
MILDKTEGAPRLAKTYVMPYKVKHKSKNEHCQVLKTVIIYLNPSISCQIDAASIVLSFYTRAIPFQF